MLSAITLELVDPFKIVVENRLNTISPYVLLEQETWFEPEVPFLYRFLKAGMRVIDIGTNCGFYTLLAAHKVGPEGHVWGFEPGLKPARLLRESLRINSYNNVTLHEAAMGLKPGTVWFFDKDQTELSMVVEEGTPGAREVKVESLDHLYQTGAIPEIDFIKIDAEGFEDQVIAGGMSFFKETSPLVMLEVAFDANPTIDMGPAETLASIGYELYRYSSGAECLAPFVKNRLGDFVLNIFLCKPDRAASLREARLLVTANDLENHYEPADPNFLTNFFAELSIIKSCEELRNMIGSLGLINDPGYNVMATEYLLSQDKSRPIAERIARLTRADLWIERNFTNDMSFAQVLTLIRVWAATGRRALVAGMLKIILQGESGMTFTIQYPFLPVSAKWDTIEAKDGQFYPWVASMISEMLEAYRSFSSLYDSEGTRDAYNLSLSYGYLTEDLERSAAIATLIRGYDQFPKPVFIAGPIKRNRAIWNEIAQRLARGEKGVIKLDAGTDLA